MNTQTHCHRDGPWFVSQIRSGNADAESELVTRYSRPLQYMLRRLTGDPDQSDDLHQETFRVVLEHLRAGRVQEPDKLPAFLRATARNIWIGQSRRKREVAADLQIREPIAPENGPSSDLIRRENVRLVHQLLGELKHDRDRELLTRFYLAEEDKDTLCADYGVDSLYFNQLLNRARQRFRQLWTRTAKRQNLGEAK